MSWADSPFGTTETRFGFQANPSARATRVAEMVLRVLEEVSWAVGNQCMQSNNH